MHWAGFSACRRAVVGIDCGKVTENRGNYDSGAPCTPEPGEAPRACVAVGLSAPNAGSGDKSSNGVNFQSRVDARLG
jgi:hypothetical protein